MKPDLRVGQEPSVEKRNVMNPVRAAKIAAKRLGISTDEYLQRRASGEKWCWGCREWHPLAAFNTDRTRQDGYANLCRRAQQRRDRWPEPFQREHKTREELMEVSTAPQIDLLRIEQLVIDPRYQRALDEKRAERIADEFHWDQFGVLEVNARADALFAVFDGQHRLHAATKLGLEAVPCLIHSGLSAEEEAILFTLLQTKRKGLSQVDRFRAQVFGGDERATDIDRIVRRNSYEVEKAGANRNAINAVVALERTYRRFGPQHLDRTLGELRALWADDPGSTRGKFIEGLGHFLAEYGDARYDAEAKDKLREVAPLTFLRRAEATHAGDVRASIAVAKEINKTARISGRPRTFKKPESV